MAQERAALVRIGIPIHQSTRSPPSPTKNAGTIGLESAGARLVPPRPRLGERPDSPLPTGVSTRSLGLEADARATPPRLRPQGLRVWARRNARLAGTVGAAILAPTAAMPSLGGQGPSRSRRPSMSFSAFRPQDFRDDPAEGGRSKTRSTSAHGSVRGRIASAAKRHCGAISGVGADHTRHPPSTPAARPALAAPHTALIRENRARRPRAKKFARDAAGSPGRQRRW